MNSLLDMKNFPLSLPSEGVAGYCKDDKGNIVTANKETLCYFGLNAVFDSVDEIMGKNEEDFISLNPSYDQFYEKSLSIDKVAWEAREPKGFLIDVPNFCDIENNIAKLKLSGHKVEILKFPQFNKDNQKTCMFTLVFDLTASKSYSDQNAILSNKLDMSMEEERKNLARDIHDVIGNSITAIRMSLNMIKLFTESDDKEKALANIASATKVCEEAAVEVRRISTGLRPGILNEYGIIESINWLADDFSQRYIQIDFRFSTEINPDDLSYLPEATTIAMFRICQESISNAIKHAKCSSVDISLFYDDNLLVMQIKDNGVGIDLTDSKGLGVPFMLERAKMVGAELLVENDLGTKIAFILNKNVVYDVLNRKNLNDESNNC